MPKTKMVARDFQMFAGALSTFYTPLFGTPAADVAKRLNAKLQDALTYTADEEPEEENAEVVPLDEGGYKISLRNRDFIPEEILRENGVDETVNEAIDELEQGIRDHLYPENSYQRVMVDHMLAGLKAIQKRDFIYDIQSNPNADEIPAAAIDRKNANYTFAPKMVGTGMDEEGNEIDVFPEGFAEDDAEHGFIPRADAKDLGKHTAEELQTAADMINYKGLGESADSYTTSVREVLDLATAKKPRDAAQDGILRQHILTNIEYVRQQINRARHADPADPKMRAIFMDDLKKVDDSLFSDTRGLGGDLENLDQYERYIRSGLPIAGFSEYRAMVRTAFNLIGPTNQVAENTVGLEGLVAASRDIDARLRELPEENATEEQRNAWRDGVKEAMQRYQSELKKVDPEKIQFKEGVKDDAKANIRNNLSKNLTFVHESRNIEGHLENLDQLGEKSIQERRNYVRGMMKSMVDGMDDISKELKQRAKNIRTDDRDFKDAFDKAIYAGDSDNEASPQRFSQALTRLQTEAATNNQPELAGWLGRQRAWFDNRMKEAQAKGVMLDESLNFQLRVNERKGRERIDSALQMFNTKRSRIFGKDKESDEHRLVREAAEDLVKARNELRALRDNEGTDAWRQKAEEVMAKSETVSRLAMTYINVKKQKGEGKTPAGRDRMAGAAFLYRESEITRTMLKKRIAANEKYTELSGKTATIAQKLDPDALRNDPVAEANAKKVRELIKQEEAAKKREAQEKSFKGAKASIAEGAPVKESKVKEIDIDQMQRKFKLDKPEHEFQGRKPKEDADKKAHEMDKPVVQGQAPRK